MKMEISVAEAMELINEIRQQPDSLFEMIRGTVKENVGKYLSELVDSELTGFPGRGRYERVEGGSNHRNGSYGRRYTEKSSRSCCQCSFQSEPSSVVKTEPPFP